MSYIQFGCIYVHADTYLNIYMHTYAPTYTQKGQYLYPIHFDHKIESILNNANIDNENNNVHHHHHYQHSHEVILLKIDYSPTVLSVCIRLRSLQRQLKTCMGQTNRHHACYLPQLKHPTPMLIIKTDFVVLILSAMLIAHSSFGNNMSWRSSFGKVSGQNKITTSFHKDKKVQLLVFTVAC